MNIVLERKTTEVFKIDLHKVRENENPKFVEKCLKIATKGRSFETLREFLAFDFESMNDEFLRCKTYADLAYILISTPEKGFLDKPLEYLVSVSEEGIFDNGGELIEFINKYFADKLDRNFEGLSVIDTYIDITENDSDYRY